jgi:O-antigen/teichoic acid export membrane protein
MKPLGVEKVLKGMVSLLFGTGIAKFISVLAIPFLTRIYTPEEYGVLAVFTASVLMIVPLLSLRYVVAIALPRTSGGALNLAALSLSLVAFFGVIFFLLMLCGGEAIFKALSMEALVPYWWLVCLAAICIGVYEIFSMLELRKKNYKMVAYSQALQSLMGEAVKVSFGLLAVKPIGLLLGQSVGYSVGAVLLIVRGSFGRQDVKQIRFRRMLKLLLIFKEMALFRTPSQFFLAYSIQAPLVFSSVLYSGSEVGQLSLALMALALPIILLGQSMSRAYYAEIASIGARGKETVREITKAISLRLLLISLLPTALLVFFGEFIFTLIFGGNWALAGKVSSILAMYLIGQFVTSPLLEVFNLYGGQKVYLELYFFRAILVTVAYLASFLLGFNFLQSVICYTALMFCYFAVVGLKILTVLYEQDSEIEGRGL